MAQLKTGSTAGSHEILTVDSTLAAGKVSGSLVVDDITTTKITSLTDKLQLQSDGEADDMTLELVGTRSTLTNDIGKITFSNDSDTSGSPVVASTLSVTGEGVMTYDNDLTVLGDLSLDDSSKIYCGDSNDLTINHSGTNSLITHSGTGYLYTSSATNLVFRTNSTEPAINCIANAGVKLYYDNASKLDTTTDGIDVSGNIKSTNKIVAGEGGGSVAFTLNDGYGNANLTFNHVDGKPDLSGSSGRITSAVDSTTASMIFELKDDTVLDTAEILTYIVKLQTSKIDLYKPVEVTGTITTSAYGSEIKSGDNSIIFQQNACDADNASIGAGTNLHIDSCTGGSLFLNYYGGTGTYFGDGGNGVTAKINGNGSIESTDNTSHSLSTNGALLLGEDSTYNMSFDKSHIQARNNGAKSTLNINTLGGWITMGDTTTQIKIEGTGASSSSITGALKVAGGVGVNGELYTSGNIITESGDIIASSRLMWEGGKHSWTHNDGANVSLRVGHESSSGDVSTETGYASFWNFNQSSGLWQFRVSDASVTVGNDVTWETSNLDLAQNGNLTARGDITAYSDIRVKENLEVIPDAIDKIQQISGYTFDRIDTKDNKRHTGVIAQELLEVLPEAVILGETEDDIMSVAYGNMVGLLIEGIKELEARIKVLEER